MKSDRNTSTTKLVARFDNELKMLLLNDLKEIRAAKKNFLHSNNQARVRSRLSVA
ncbi:MAG: hypothetical protein ACTHJ8_08720 [Mucilaginibacter sp.]